MSAGLVDAIESDAKAQGLSVEQYLRKLLKSASPDIGTNAPPAPVAPYTPPPPLPENEDSIPIEHRAYFEREAKAYGMRLKTYLLFAKMCVEQNLSPQFKSAVRFMFTKHGETLRRLAEHGD